MNRNWRTTWSGIAAEVVAALTLIAALPYELGDVAMIISPEWKAFVTKAGIAATFVLKVIKSVSTADAKQKPEATWKRP